MYARALPKGLSIDTVIELGEDKFKTIIQSIGLANTKAKNIYKLSQILKLKHASKVPKSREDLESLPGVGRKTANVILGELFSKPTLAVDTHVLELVFV